MKSRRRSWDPMIIPLGLCLALVLMLSLPASANTGRVLLVCPRGCPYSSIGAALAQANAGDIVQVGPGIYLEHITMRPGVIIRGERSDVSIITGGDADTVVRADSAEIDRTAILERLTIVAGKAYTGGGIDIRGGASPTIRYNVITGNTAGSSESYGGGIFISGGSPLIAQNMFHRNYATWSGGAIAIWDGSTAVITGNHFQDNKAYQYGGAINVTRSSPTITGNTFISNTAVYGGGIEWNGSAGEFANNVLSCNTAFLLGGGMYLRNGSTPSVFANSFASNTAYYYGGGLYMDRSTPSVAGNTFEANDADSGGAIYVERSSPTVARNTIVSNTTSYHGGGIHIHNSNGVFDNNNIQFNVATIGGGGLGVDGHSLPVLKNNTLGNNATGLFGGAVYIEGAAPSLVNNMIILNTSGYQGGGVYVKNAAPLIQNNTIVYNHLAGNGEGIYLAQGSAPTITNNIIVHNTYGIVSAKDMTSDDNAPLIIRNNIWDNPAGNLVGVSNADNIIADPLFVRGREGDFYLSQVSAGQSQNSPALDAGTDPASELGLDERTTAVHDLPDDGMVDLGFHYRALFHKTYLPIICDEQ